ncbi:MAG: prepilin-type N-terminal cleavage/methylation domain-containing protein [Sumerlaeia bacterium]
MTLSSHGKGFGSQAKAFTLIELLIVVAIIAILAAIAVPNFLEAQVRSKVSRAKADMRAIATAIESYAVDNNKYHPGTSNVSGTIAFATTTVPGVDQPVGNQVNPRIERFSWITTPVAYITSIPSDPFAPSINELATDPNKAFPTFTYWDAPFTDNTKVNGFGGQTPEDLWRDMPNELPSRNTWSLLSFAPDGDFEPAELFRAGSGQVAFSLYDPTNGTISDGDVWRSSGGIPNS